LLTSNQPKIPHYSTVTDCFRSDVPDPKKKKDFFLEISFTLCIKSSKLNISHYNPYQQKLYRLVKFMKEKRGIGYKRISHIMTEKGYRSVRTKSFLKSNYIYSIYKNGKKREERIERNFKSTIEDVMCLVRDL